MEYKVRYHKKQKAHKTKNRLEAGFVRVKIRGRKRWIRTKPVAETKAEA